MKLPITITALISICSFLCAQGISLNDCEGWATCSSIYSGGDYELTGGNNGSIIVLKSNGNDMREAIRDAVVNHDVIIFDGSCGEFELSSHVSFQSLIGRTLIGINGASIITKFSVTQEIRDLLDGLNVNSLSQNAEDNLGGTLSNGSYVKEQRELTIRQAIIDRYGDQKEQYRYSGGLVFNNCSNIILKNLSFTGPGSIDVGGSDLVTFVECDHMWVDHCRFTDGMDGNLDIISNSDFVTVSDCHFRYTDKSYNHPLSNLTSGTEITDGSPQKNNISWIRCFWDEGCTGRMPYTTLGIQHILNCYWDCTKGTCVDAHNLCRVLIENSYFTSKVGKALAVRHDNVSYEWRGSVWQSRTSPASNSKIDVPYSYTVESTASVPAKVKLAGPDSDYKFVKPLSSSPSTIDFGKVYAGFQLERKFNISAYGDATPSRVSLTAPEGVTLSLNPGGNYSSSIIIEATDDNLLNADVYLKACFSHPLDGELSISVSAGDNEFFIPLTADIVKLDGDYENVTLSWPLDKGVSNAVNATMSHPEAFNEATFEVGSKIFVHSSKKIGNSKVFTLFNPEETIGMKPDDECCIVFDVIASPGFAFAPNMLKLDLARVGTDMCLVDIECSINSGNSRKLISAFQPVRSSNSPYYSEIELPLSDVGAVSSLQIKIYVYNMANNKQIAIGDVKIDGFSFAADSSIESVLFDGNNEAIEYYDLTGRKTNHPQPGKVYLMSKPSGNEKIILLP